MKSEYAIVIIGGGPAGLAAAIAAYDAGVTDILIIERDERLGGILNQCIHNGFGLTRFKESLTGPEYAARFIDGVSSRNIQVAIGTTVLSLSPDKTVTAINAEEGVFQLKARAVVLAMGCRERSRGALQIAGSRPAGIYSAGTAQKFVNIKGYLPGKEVVILGSGDIGLIMARRMTLEGAKVHAVCEIMPYSSGLKRNVAQCLDDFNIPLYLNHTITEIIGEKRVTGVVVSEVDANKRPIAGTQKYIACDTILFSVGLIPENELTNDAGIPTALNTRGAIVDQNRETEMDGVFACGNVLHVHDLVDFVSEEAEIAGRSAAAFVQSESGFATSVPILNGENVNYVVPQKWKCESKEQVKLFFRVKNIFRDCIVEVKSGEEILIERKKRIVTPGEMETLVLTEKMLSRVQDPISVRIKVNE